MRKIYARRKASKLKRSSRFRLRRRRYGSRKARVYRKSGFRPTKKIYPSRTPFPDVSYTKLKFCEFVPLVQSAAGVGAVYIYRGNSLYDPNYTGTGVQPYLYDQWTNLYNRYTVLGSKIKVSFYSNGNTINTQTLALTVGPTRSTTSVFSSVGDIASTQVVPYFKSTTANLYKGSVSISNYINSTVPFGVKKSQILNDDQFQAVYNANPATNWYWQIGMASLSSADQGSMLMKVEITYYVRFNERFLQSSS